MTFKSFSFFSISILVLGFAVAYRVTSVKVTKIPKEENITFVATVKKEPRVDGENQIISVGDVRIYTDVFPRYRVGDRLRVKGKAGEFGNIYNPRIKKIGESKLFSGYFARIREKISQNIFSIIPSREATLVVGTVLGVDSIDKSFRDQLIRTGTIHVVVVSGQNLMIVAGVFLTLAKYLGRRLSLSFALFAVLFYMFLTGFEPPVLRAGLMVMFGSLAIYFGRQMISIWSLFIAALVIAFFAPNSVFEVSFQLTFAATFGIMTLGQYLTKIFNSKFSILNFLSTNAAIAISAYIFTAPIIIFYFGKVSVLSPLVNVLIAESVFPIMILGFIVAIFSLIFLPIAQIFAYFAYAAAFYFVKVVEIFSYFPLGYFEIESGNVFLLISLYLFLALVFIGVFLRKAIFK